MTDREFDAAIAACDTYAQRRHMAIRYAARLHGRNEDSDLEAAAALAADEMFCLHCRRPTALTEAVCNGGLCSVCHADNECP